LDANGKIILKLMLKKEDGRAWTALNGPTAEQMKFARPLVAFPRSYRAANGMKC